MIEGIVYTSAARGLKLGSSGFCTVASTPGMAAPLASFLESLSAYRHLDAPGGENPVIYNHLTAVVAGRKLHVLSRIADAGLDYSGRSNKIAHHVAIPENEGSDVGPVWLQMRPEFHVSQWTGDARILPATESLPVGSNSPRRPTAWERIAGDAGWAGVLTRGFRERRPRTQWIIYPRDVDIIELIGEVAAILPRNLRWKATYSTFCINLPPVAKGLPF